MKTILETIQAGAGYLEKRGIENGRLNMQHLVAHVLGCDRMQLYVDFDRPLEETELAPLRELLKRRGEGEPLQHLLGTVPFAGHDFRTDSRALIPRPETEQLVDLLIQHYAGKTPPEHVLDMGTGSGVIGLSLAAAWRDNVKSVVLADVSPEALALARENLEVVSLGELEAVELLESNLFSALDGRKFDLIVANLPYIAAAEISELSVEVQHDPALALDGGAVGTELMHRFILEAPPFLNANGRIAGRIAMEYGEGQSAELQKSLQSQDWRDINVTKDFEGIDRFLFATR